MKDVRLFQDRPVIQGASVQNQRIERLWVDVWKDVTHVFYNLFYYLEQQGELDPSDQIDLFCLHYVFLPRINRCLKEFVDQWNNHGLRTEGNKSPVQLFVGKSMELSDSNHTGIQDMGNDVPSPSNVTSASPAVDNTNHVMRQRQNARSTVADVPSVPPPVGMSDDDLAEIKCQVDPLANDVDNVGIYNFVAFKQLVLQKLAT